MANVKTRKAEVRATGELIEVYRLKSGEWCNSDDCTTKYSDNDLRFLD